MAIDNGSNPFEFRFDTNCSIFEYFSPLLESLRYNCDSPYYENDPFCYMSSSYEQDQIQQDLLPYIWRDCDCCFTIDGIGYPEDNSFSNANSTGNFEHQSELEKIKHRFQSEEYEDSYLLDYDVESQLPFDNTGGLWHFCKSWFSHVIEEDFSYEKQKSVNSQSYSLDETGFYEGIFG